MCSPRLDNPPGRSLLSLRSHGTHNRNRYFSFLESLLLFLFLLPFPDSNLLHSPKSLFFLQGVDIRVLRKIREWKQKRFQRKRFRLFCCNLFSGDHREVAAMWTTAKNISSGPAINIYVAMGRILLLSLCFTMLK